MHRTIIIAVFFSLFNSCSSKYLLIESKTTGHSSEVEKINKQLSFSEIVMEEKDIKNFSSKAEIYLEDLIEVAKSLNPQINEARKAFCAAEGRIRQAGLYSNPIISYEMEDIPGSNFDFSKGKNTVSITQPIIFGKSRLRSIEEASLNRDILFLTFLNKSRESLLGVHLAYLELLYLKEVKQLYRDLLTLSRKNNEMVQIRFNAKVIPETDVFKAEMKVHELEMCEKKIQLRHMIVSSHLSALMGDVSVTVENIKGKLFKEFPSFSLGQLISILKKSDPEILSKKKQIEAAEKHLEQLKSERLSVVDVFGAFSQNREEDKNTFTAGISFPLPVFDRNQGKISEARYLIEQAKEHLASCVLNQTQIIKVLYSEYQSLKNNFSVYSNTLEPGASKVFNQSLDAFHAGRIGISDLIESQNTLAEIRIRVLEILWNMNIAYVRVTRLAGMKL